MRRRWIILAVGLATYTAFMVWLATLLVQIIGRPPNEWLAALHSQFFPSSWIWTDPDWQLLCVLPVVVLVLSQMIFVVPIVNCHPLQQGRGRSLRVSMIMAALVAVVLTVGLAFALLGLVQLTIGNSRGNIDFTGPHFYWRWILLGLVVVNWACWSIMLLLFARRRQGNDVFSRALGLLLGGTIAEVVVVMPLDIMLRRKTDCYCGTGSFWALCASMWALLWLSGPGIVIALTSKRRRAWALTHCIQCGYEKGPSPGQRCPECGFVWDNQEEKQPRHPAIGS